MGHRSRGPQSLVRSAQLEDQVPCADFNGDQHPDVVFRDTTTGALYIWFLNGVNVTSQGYFNGGLPVDLKWQLVGAK